MQKRREKLRENKWNFGNFWNAGFLIFFHIFLKQRNHLKLFLDFFFFKVTLSNSLILNTTRCVCPSNLMYINYEARLSDLNKIIYQLFDKCAPQVIYNMLDLHSWLICWFWVNTCNILPIYCPLKYYKS